MWCFVYWNYPCGDSLAYTFKPNCIYSVGSTWKGCSPFRIHIHNAGIWCRWCAFIGSDKNSSLFCSRHTEHSLLHKWVFLHNHETGATTIYKERPISCKYFGKPLLCGMSFIWHATIFWRRLSYAHCIWLPTTTWVETAMFIIIFNMYSQTCLCRYSKAQVSAWQQPLLSSLLLLCGGLWFHWSTSV